MVAKLQQHVAVIVCRSPLLGVQNKKKNLNKIVYGYAWSMFFFLKVLHISCKDKECFVE